MNKKVYPSETLDVRIEKLTEAGLGFARHIHPPEKGAMGRHLKLLVDHTVPGDLVRVTVPNAKGRRNARIYQYDELLVPSPDRNPQIHPTDELAGGTPLLAMKYEAQLAHKEGMVRSYLQEADFDSSVVRPIIGMDQPERYRNKMDLTFGANGELGMHRQGNYLEIIDMEDSILAPQVMVTVKHLVSQWQEDYQLSGYNKESQSGLLRNLVLRLSHATGELMVGIYATEGASQHVEAVQALVQRLQEAVAELASLLWITHTAITDQVQTEALEVLYGRDHIKESLAGYHYRVWHDTFFQPNPIQAEQMVQTALDFIGDDPIQQAVDLFCGVGTFSLPLAERSDHLIGIEIVDQSIESAKRNAQDNQISNTEFIVSDARTAMRQLEASGQTVDVLLLDPPRSGAGGKVSRAISRMSPQRIIYVSCNPKSMVQDMQWMHNFGYQVQAVQPIDQFPHTAHVECVVLLEKKS